MDEGLLGQNDLSGAYVSASYQAFSFAGQIRYLHRVKDVGTHVQCRSLKFQKTVSYLSEICQKTVSHTNLSENSQNCVRYLSEISQMQKYVRYMFKKLQKCLRKVSEVINLLENYHFQICKTVRILSEISILTDF